MTMQKKINWFGILSIVLVIGLLVMGLMYYNLNTKANELQRKIGEKDSVISQRDVQISNLNSQIENITKKLASITVEKEVVSTPVKTGYLLDELYLDTAYSKELSDREINLFDGQIRFDGDDYDAEEVLTINGVVISANGEDFNGQDYLTIPKNSIEYSFNIEDSFDSSLVDDDENKLELNLLGKEVTITDWNGDTITFSKGTKHLLYRGDSLTVDNKTVKLEYVMDGSVYVTVGDESKEISKGQTKTVNGVEIKVETVIYDEVSPTLAAIIIVGDEVEETVSNGDDYEDGDLWRWSIDSNSIGIILNDEFMELDDELTPLSAGESICLPNDYVCIKYNGLIEEDTEEYRFEMDKIDGVKYIEAKGTFLDGIHDYDKIYIDPTGIYDEDLNLIGTSVKVGDSDLILELSTDGIKIDDIELPYDLTDIKVNGTSISSKEDDYRTNYGILIDSPEDSVDDQEIKLVIPEEKLEGTLTI